MRFIVCGGRDFTDRDALFSALDRLSRRVQIDAIIEGNARGADRLAGYWARSHGILNLKFRPIGPWPAAGPLRNQRMIDEGKPDGVVAFPTGGPGTADMIRRAKAAGLEVWEPLARNSLTGPIQ